MTTYQCDECRATGVKLWRIYQSMYIHLLCADCAAKAANENIDGIDPVTGKRDVGLIAPSDSIGFFIPAVPVEGEDGFWGYLSVPDGGVAWWRALPLRKADSGGAT